MMDDDPELGFGSFPDLDAVEIMGAPRHFDRQGRPITMRRWAELIESSYREDGEDYRRIGLDHITDEIFVSTVWLGINHRFGGDGAPLIFETMVFGRGDDELGCMRYCTEGEALDGHRRTVADLQAGLAPWFERDAVDQGQDPCPVCREDWHGLDDPVTGCPGAFATETEIKEWKRKHG